MDFSFGDEEKALADAFRDFIKREVKPVEEQLRPLLVESDDPPELRDELLKIRRRSAELGFYSVDIPTEFGGGGLSYVGQALLREVAGSSGSFLAIACLSGPEGPTGLIQGMKPALRERLVPSFLRAEISAAFALTEPDAGSDNQSMKTRATRDAEGWIINGSKHFITNGRHADFVQLFAVTDPEKKAAGGVTCFVVEKGTPGFSVGKNQAVISGGEGPCELVFDDCRVPDENVIGEVGMGFYAAMQFLTGGRANIGAMCVGIGDYLMRTSVEYAKNRVQFGKPIGKMQGVAFQIADMALEVELARLATYKLAWLADQGEPLIQAAAFSKLYATEMVGRAADTAIQVHGGMGLTRELGLERIYRFVRILRVVEGTSEVQRYLISKSLGL
ncbi:MAG TPA: acyl-CoA dehydrogenase family protein [Candidatus Solibacter sp.]|jgi:alkylation response protein AidB-like acyl-CoA dehydrogenase|nr:acyl-CoA dehydrogenase family protein [Candidatus Solibacter sp.]